MLVRAVTGVDDAATDPVGKAVRCTTCGVSYDDTVGTHRLQRESGVFEALALGHTRALGREVDDVGGQSLGSDLERRPRAGRVLEEEIDDGAPAQCRQLLDRPV